MLLLYFFSEIETKDTKEYLDDDLDSTDATEGEDLRKLRQVIFFCIIASLLYFFVQKQK